jgi:hypothetical protein
LVDRPFPVVTVASCFALAGFAVAIFAGLGAERTAADVLGRFPKTSATT